MIVIICILGILFVNNKLKESFVLLFVFGRGINIMVVIVNIFE